MTKRFFAAFLAVILALSLLPGAALASGDSTPDSVNVTLQTNNITADTPSLAFEIRFNDGASPKNLEGIEVTAEFSMHFDSRSGDSTVTWFQANGTLTESGGTYTATINQPEKGFKPGAWDVTLDFEVNGTRYSGETSNAVTIVPGALDKSKLAEDIKNCITTVYDTSASTKEAGKLTLRPGTFCFRDQYGNIIQSYNDQRVTVKVTNPESGIGCDSAATVGSNGNVKFDSLVFTNDSSETKRISAIQVFYGGGASGAPTDYVEISGLALDVFDNTPAVPTQLEVAISGSPVTRADETKGTAEWDGIVFKLADANGKEPTNPDLPTATTTSENVTCKVTGTYGNARLTLTNTGETAVTNPKVKFTAGGVTSDEYTLSGSIPGKKLIPKLTITSTTLEVGKTYTKENPGVITLSSTVPFVGGIEAEMSVRWTIQNGGATLTPITEDFIDVDVDSSGQNKIAILKVAGTPKAGALTVTATADAFEGEGVKAPVTSDPYTLGGGQGTTDPDKPTEPTNPTTPTTPTTPSDNGGSSSSGGGSYTPPSSNTTTTTTTNPNGSTTTKTENKTTGTVTETTKNTDGSQTVVETKKDGTVTTTQTDKAGNKTETVSKTDGSRVTTVQNKDGSTSTTTVSASGQTQVAATVPSAAATAAQVQGEAVPVAMPEVSVGSASDAPAITVNTGVYGEVKVEIPVSNATAGTVAVVVNPDGTEEVVKTSLVTENGVSVPVADGATVKIVDNTKSFLDVAAHWAGEAINFVTSREIFSGTGNGAFSPDETMTRAMWATALAKYDGQDVGGGSVWYEKGMSWAVRSGVSDGSSPNGQITREQLATMLYNYAGRPAVTGGALHFTDADRISEYARPAVTWAVQNGLITGMGDGTLNPRGSATRAQVTSIMMNFCKNISK